MCLLHTHLHIPASIYAMYLPHTHTHTPPALYAMCLCSSLVGLLAHQNLHVASQALTSLLAITREELYPWHEPPLTSDGRGPKQGPDRLLWWRMYELSR